jgi:hypothetical protein
MFLDLFGERAMFLRLEYSISLVMGVSWSLY